MPLKVGIIFDNLNFPSFVTVNDFSMLFSCSMEKSSTFLEIVIEAVLESVVVVVAFDEELLELLLEEDELDDEEVEHGLDVDVESTVHEPEEQDVWIPQLPEVHK